MISASVYWALPYSKVSSPSTSRSASLSAPLSLILHVAKPVPVDITEMAHGYNEDTINIYSDLIGISFCGVGQLYVIYYCCYY